MEQALLQGHQKHAKGKKRPPPMAGGFIPAAFAGGGRFLREGEGCIAGVCIRDGLKYTLPVCTV